MGKTRGSTEKKAAVKPVRLDKHLPLAHTLRDKICLLQTREDMQAEDFKVQVGQALTSIVDFQSPMTWAPNLYLGDGFFYTPCTGAFLVSVQYIHQQGYRNESKSVFAELVARVEQTQNPELITGFFEVLEEQLQKQALRQPLPKIFSGSPEFIKSDIDKMIKGMKNMLFIQIIHK